MSYYNQRNHRALSRHAIRDVLLQLARAQVRSSPTAASRQDHFDRLLRLAGSDLERSWLTFLRNRQLSLPARAQELVEACKTRPDFLYPDCNAAIYIDGPPHDFPERQVRDAALTALMEDHDFMVIRFRHTDDWLAIIEKHPSVFGKTS